MCRDLGLGDQLSHLLSDSPSKVPHVTVPLVKPRSRERRVGSFSVSLQRTDKPAPFTLFLGTDHAVDCRHVTGIRVDVDGVDRDLGLWNQLLVVVGLQIPDVNHAALVSDNQLRLENTQDVLFMDSTRLQANTLNSIKIRIKKNKYLATTINELAEASPINQCCPTWFGCRHTQLIGALTWNIL